MRYGLPFLTALYGNQERAANGKSTVCYGQLLQVSVGTLFYSLEGNTNPPDGEANETVPGVG